jgi:hypothetical protein
MSGLRVSWQRQVRLGDSDKGIWLWLCPESNQKADYEKVIQQTSKCKELLLPTVISEQQHEDPYQCEDQPYWHKDDKIAFDSGETERLQSPR